MTLKRARLDDGAFNAALHWNAIERHPRLVFDWIDETEEWMIRYYLERGEPFTVVIR